MSDIILQTFNLYVGLAYSLGEAQAFMQSLKVLPLPERAPLTDWRVHVPMHLLEAWPTLTLDERITIYVIAESASHPYDAFHGPDEPGNN